MLGRRGPSRCWASAVDVHATYAEAMRAAGYEYWRTLLIETDQRVPQAALIAGVHRTSAYKIMQKHGIRFTHPHVGSWDEQGLACLCPLCRKNKKILK